MRVIIFLTILALSLNIKAEVSVEPIYAADQERMTAETLVDEGVQFSLLYMVQDAKDRVSFAQAEFSLKKKNYERAKALVKKDIISKIVFAEIEFKFNKANADVTSFLAEVEEAEAQVALVKLQMLQQGNPSQDYLAAVAKAREDLLNARIKVLNAQLEQVKVEQNFVQFKNKGSEKLFKQKLISAAEHDNLDLNNKRIELRTAAIKKKLQLVEKEKKSLNLMGRRL